MTELKTTERNFANLVENPYPGRLIIMGLSEDGNTALQVYGLMGRSENSRNRVMVLAQDAVRTEAFDSEKVTDPSLIIYNAMAIPHKHSRVHIVSNGDQTDTAADWGWQEEHSFQVAMMTRTYEPDDPNFTPRITGKLTIEQSLPPVSERGAAYEFSVIRKSGEMAVHAFFSGFFNPEKDGGEGLCVHTYLGDGSPLPSFDADPYVVPLGKGVEDTAEMYWEALDNDNRVSLAVKGIDIDTNDVKYQIVNAHEQ